MPECTMPYDSSEVEEAGMAATNIDKAVPRRGPVFGSHYAISTDHPQSAQAGMIMMQRGGTAGDALVAAAAVNCVTKPYATQLGGDAFALIWRRKTNEVECLNAGGLAPRRATLEEYGGKIPTVGPRSVTVPGFIDALMELYRGYATLPLSTLLAPAIRLAEEGFPVSVRFADAIALLPDFTGPETAALRQAYLKDGRTPYRPGETIRQPALAATLKRIVEDERDGFYAGETADYMARTMAQHGGLLDQEDMKEPLAHWHEPIKTTYGGCDVYEQALPSQGMILLEALNIVENFPLAKWGHGTADTVHVMVEAIKLAFADRRRYAADPLVESVPIDLLLSKEHAKRRAKEIDLARTKEHGPALLRNDTTSFVVADEGTAIAFIQTIYNVWGSRLYIPDAGIVMTNRLSGFSADPSNPNHLAPGKRTVHTLNNFLCLRDGELVFGGGTPGSDFQVQTNLQNVVGALTWGFDLQRAIDAPRWGWTSSGALAIEERFPPETLDDLVARGHDLQRVGWGAGNGYAHVIASLPDGGWGVGSDIRGEGLALAQ
jgi:gamma-glutamyltranspeptidase / glutathione hydrolase